MTDEELKALKESREDKPCTHRRIVSYPWLVGLPEYQAMCTFCQAKLLVRMSGEIRELQKDEIL